MIELEQMQLIKCQMAPEMNTILIIKRQQTLHKAQYRQFYVYIQRHRKIPMEERIK